MHRTICGQRFRPDNCARAIHMQTHVTRQKLVAVLDDDPQCRKLKMELAMTVDGMEPFVKATYALEGDGMHVCPRRLLIHYTMLSTILNKLYLLYTLCLF